jgi:hypothetical protein
LFLFIGVLSLSLFFLVAALDRAGETNIAQRLAGPMQVLILPIYLVWMLIAMAQSQSWHQGHTVYLSRSD